jgi:AraC-like DNA-binding protein
MANNDWASASYIMVMMYWNSARTTSDTSYMEYLHKANELAVRAGDNARLGNNLINTGRAYLSLNEPGKALSYLKEGYRYDQMGNMNGNAYSEVSLAKAYLALDSLIQAREMAMKGMNSAVSTNETRFLPGCYEVLARIFLKAGVPDSAQYYLAKSVCQLTANRDSTMYPGMYQRFAEISTGLGEYQNALRFLDTSYQQYQRIMETNNQNDLDDVRAVFDYKVQRAEIKELAAKNKFQKERSRRILILLTGILLILLVVSSLSALLFRQNKKLVKSYRFIINRNQELVTLNKTLLESRITNSRAKLTRDIPNEANLAHQLKDILEQGEIVKDPELSLPRLADRLNTNTSYLSAVINTVFGVNFKTLINQARITAAQEMLHNEKYKHFSIEGIGQESGFKSRSGFITTFKQFTGVTPSIYRNEYAHSFSSDNSFIKL